MATALGGEDPVARTRLVPPRLPPRWLARPRLNRRLAEAGGYPLTVVEGSAGFGKSSALAAYAAQAGHPVLWYSLADGVDDPGLFLRHLVAAARTLVPGAGGRSLSLLSAGGTGAAVWHQALIALVNDLVAPLPPDTLLILDDYHLADDHPALRDLVDDLLRHLPPHLHLLLATRRTPQLASVPTLRARGEVLLISEADLAFTAEETTAFLAGRDGPGAADARAVTLAAQTAGWPIALQLVRQGAALVGAPSGTLDDAAREALFAYLAAEVLEQQPSEVRALLLRSAVLRELEPAACAAVLGLPNAATALRDLYRRGLFLTALGDGRYRYHPLFRDFLQARAAAEGVDAAALHRAAADYDEGAGNAASALEHRLAAGDAPGAAETLARWAPHWLAAGRVLPILDWLQRLPGDAVAARPGLWTAAGEAARRLGRYAEAHAAFERARVAWGAAGDALGEAAALQGAARTFLDTGEPAPAAARLHRAFRLLPPAHTTARADALALLAGARLAEGRTGRAARLCRCAESLAPGVEPADARLGLLLRQGRLAEARALLGPEMDPALAATVCALQGDPEAAAAYAGAALTAAERQGAPLAEVAAHVAVGHAAQLAAPSDPAAANEHYLRALAVSAAAGLPRAGAGAYLGLTLLHGFAGDLAAAQAAAHEGLALVEPEGDAWQAALIWTALAAVGAAAGTLEAHGWAATAGARAARAGDRALLATAVLWQAIALHRRGDLSAAEAWGRRALALSAHAAYPGLYTAPTLLGPRDRVMLVPPLLAGRGDSALDPWAGGLLARAFPALAADYAVERYHPGVTLRVRLLGPLRVWRGPAEVAARGWQRRKAPALLAFLLTHRTRWVPRDQICEALWPDEDAREAESQFKVTLNALNAVLEPTRPPRTPPYYVRRQGSAYRFVPEAGVWLDVVAFDEGVAAAEALLAPGDPAARAEARARLATAVALVQDDYLSDWLYEDWARDARTRIMGRYLTAATALARLLLDADDLGEATQMCEQVLSRDPGWEDAYGLLMRIYARQGNRRLALATYERCVRNLRTYLDVAPLPETTRLYEALRH